MLVKRAENFAKERHLLHFRVGGEPFFNHLERVAERVKNMGGSANAIAAAFLHDSVEDGKANISEISKYFGEDVYKLIVILTRKNEFTYEDYIDSIIASNNREAMMIKLADNDDNLVSIGDGAFSKEKEDYLKSRWIKSKQKMESALG